MAQKPHFLVGLDVGTSKVAVVISRMESSSSRLEAVGVGVSPSRGLRKGVVINIDATVGSISQAMQQAETMAGVDARSAVASISGSHIKGINSSGVVAIRNREVRENDIERVIDAARAIPMSRDREVLHVLPQEFIIDEQDGIKEPLGISGVRLEARVHVITGAVASGQNVVKCANRCGLNVEDIVLSPLASGRAVLTLEEQELGVCLLDIGAGTSDLTVFQGGAIRYTSVLPIGGNHITNDVAAGLRTPVTAAEEIKIKHGSAARGLVSKTEMIEVFSTGNRSSRMVSRSTLTDIIEPRVSELLVLLHQELISAGYANLIGGGVVITGGTANLHGLNHVAEQIFDLPVRIGSPAGVIGLSEQIIRPEMACAVGLCLNAAHGNAPILRQQTQNRGPVKLLKRVGEWFGEHF